MRDGGKGFFPVRLSGVFSELSGLFVGGVRKKIVIFD